MKITYIAHSGFLVELVETAFLFDYYEGTIPEIGKEKALFIFSSHRHPDHFNPEVFKLAEKRENVTYVLSYDIWKSRVSEELQGQTVHLKPHKKWEQGGVKVETLKSTDEGVAFLIEAEGKVIYHAGDLNDWRWDGEAEEWNRKMAEHYRQFIEPLRGRKIAAAFLPLDPRQEKNYALGMDYFLELADAEKIYPMHCWEDYGVIDRWLREHPDSPCRKRIVKITARGQAFEQ